MRNTYRVYTSNVLLQKCASNVLLQLLHSKHSFISSNCFVPVRVEVDPETILRALGPRKDYTLNEITSVHVHHAKTFKLRGNLG